MNRHKLIGGLALGILVFAAACGGEDATSTPAPAPTSVPGGASTSAIGAVVKMSENPEFGAILSDDQGRTLYLFATDEFAGSSTERYSSSCTGVCAQNWPPLLTEGAPTSDGDARVDLVGTIAREDGSTQVTYNNWPLHYYSGDKKPGDAIGHNVARVWFTISVDGEVATVQKTAGSLTY